MSAAPDTAAALEAAVQLALAYDDLPEPWSSRLRGRCDAFWNAYSALPNTTGPSAPTPPSNLPEPGSYWWEICN